MNFWLLTFNIQQKMQIFSLYLELIKIIHARKVIETNLISFNNSAISLEVKFVIDVVNYSCKSKRKLFSNKIVFQKIIINGQPCRKKGNMKCDYFTLFFVCCLMLEPATSYASGK